MKQEALFPWGDSRRFYSYSRYIHNLFGARIQKLTLDAGLSCPHRSSREGQDGCTYCNNAAFNPSYCSPEKNISQQLAEGIEFHMNRYRRARKYLAYFQAYTNTFAPIEQLQKLFNEAIAHPDVVGLVVGTRPDCLSSKVINLLREISETHCVMVELGVESLHNKTLARVQRGHSAEVSLEAITRLHAAKLNVGVHLIFGLPGEGREEMIETVETIVSYPVHSIKFHQLQILEGTIMAEEWRRSPDRFTLFELNDYLSFMREIIERLPTHIAVERISAEAPPRFLLAPDWGLLRNDQILSRFELLLAEQNSWQGKRVGVVCEK